MNHLNHALTVKAIGDNGTFTGFASTPTVDRYADVIEVGALAWGATVPMLLSHDQPIGVFTRLEHTADGLLCDGQINLDVQAGREAYSLLKQGALTGLSVGIIVKDRNVVDSVRHITSAELLEISLTAMPVNPEARVTSVKAVEQAEQLSAEIAQLKAQVADLSEKHLLLELSALLKSARH